MRDLLIGTAGHIDHGKTTLLKALTGIDADRLAEEKRRGITIDLGFAHLETGGFRLGFVDVPGHERFVKNMLAGIGGIRMVLLVIAADESVMPQTREHFQICRLLGLRHGIIVLTKAGLVEPDLLELVREEVRELVAGSFLEAAPVAAVDSVTGEGMEEFKRLLLEQVKASSQAQEDSDVRHVFRLPVDRVFTLRGFGTVVTGTATSGLLKSNTAVHIYPSGQLAKVRGMQVFEKPVLTARAGQRTALNLTGIDRADLARGMVVSEPDGMLVSSMIDVRLKLLEDAPTPLKHRSPVRFHHGTAELLGRAYLLDHRELAPGASGLVQLRLEEPAVCCPGDRFILRRYSPMRTIGGGVILDNQPVKHTTRQLRTALPALQRLDQAFDNPVSGQTALLRYLIDSSGVQGLSVSELAARTGLRPQALLQSLQRTDQVTLLPGEPGLALSAPVLKSAQEKILDYLKKFHQEQPLSPGVAQPELKMRCLAGARDSLFQALLDQLTEAGKIRVTTGTVSLADHRIELSPEQAQLRDSIMACFKDEQVQSPSLDEVTRQVSGNEADVRRLFFHLLQQKELVRISQDLVLSKRQLEHLLDRLRNRFSRGSAFEVAEFKELFGISRKYAIPLLEYLDRQRITRRAADKRILL